MAACDSAVWHGTTYTTSTDTTTYTGQNVDGCDSTTTLHLTILHSSTGTDSLAACDSAVWHGTTYTTTTDTTTYTGQNVAGCDSTTTLHLTIFHSSHTDCVAMACDSALWGDVWFGSDTVLLYSGTTAEGCDSTVRLRMEIAPTPHAAMTVSPEVLSDRQLTLTATDASTGAQRIRWTIDGHYYGTEPTVTYTAPLRSDSVVLSLTAFNQHCTDTSRRTILVLHEDLIVPNVFTPGAPEGSCNRLRLYGHGITHFEIAIFNRQGATVYHSTDLDGQWDGTCNGEPCPQGTYIYIINYQTASRPTPQQCKGCVTLLR